MAFHLVVLKPFSNYKRGDVITDSASVGKILSGPQASCVIRITAKGK